MGFFQNVSRRFEKDQQGLERNKRNNHQNSAQYQTQNQRGGYRLFQFFSVVGAPQTGNYNAESAAHTVCKSDDQFKHGGGGADSGE